MKRITGSEDDVARLFNTKSVAVIGASARPGTLSWWPLELLRKNGYKGGIYPVNPTRDDIDGIRCYPTLTATPEVPELAIIALNAERTLEAVNDCAAAGVKTVVIPTQGFGELGEEGAARERELVAVARKAGMRIVGPNTDGVGNLGNGAIASIQPLFAEGIEVGPVGLATQSGATAGSLLVRLKREGIGCRLYASAGNEPDLGLNDYISYMVQHPDVKIVLSFVEALRRPKEFFAIADLAAEIGKPIVLIKVGRSEQGARRAAAHTGALAGADDLYDAAFAAHGVLRVSELSELVAVAKLFLTRGAPMGRGVGILSVSGGQAGAVADKAALIGVPVPPVSAATEAHLNALLTFGSGFNPCDVTGEIARKHDLAQAVYDAFDREPELATIIYARKHLTGDASVNAARFLCASATKPGATPLAIYAMDGAIGGAEGEEFARNAIPVFANLTDLYTAIDRLAAWSAFRVEARARAFATATIKPAVHPASVREGVVDDRIAKQLLAQYGIRFPAEAMTTTADAAAAAAAMMGFPVVLKVSSERIPHKTEAGGVVLGLKNEADVRAAFDRIRANAHRYLSQNAGRDNAHHSNEADGVLVQEQVMGGVEIIAGIKVDPVLGPFVVAGLGGVMTELLKDVAIRPAPVDKAGALEMLHSLRGASLLAGFRGAAPADMDALADTLAGLSRLAAEHAAWLQEGDLNPVLVLEAGRGVRVVDALLVAK